MRDGAPSALYEGALIWQPQVSSWLNGVLLAPAVPVVSGTFNEDESKDVPDSVTLRVPRWVDGFDWRPGNATDHPLASNGQQLAVSIVVTSLVSRASFETHLGMFQIQDFANDDGDIQITTSGLFKVILGDKPRWLLAPRPGGTFASEIRRLVPAGIGVDIDAALVDRPVPKAVAYGADRLAAIRALADAWPARIHADGFGQMRVSVPLPEVPVPVLEYVDGARGTLITAPASGSRDGIYNRVRVNANDADAAGQQPVLAVVEQEYGPFAVSTFGVETREFSSPWVKNEGQARAAGAKILRDSLRPALTRDVSCVPDPRAQNGDPVGMTFEGVSTAGYVIAAQHPLTNKDGPTKLKVGLG